MAKEKDKKNEDNKKNIVMFDGTASAKDYNDKVVAEYLNAQKLSSIKFGKDLGELIGFIRTRGVDCEEIDFMLTVLTRLLDVYIEAGTYNGVQKIVPFKFKKISKKQRERLLENMKRKFMEQQGKLIKKEENKTKDTPPNYTG